MSKKHKYTAEQTRNFERIFRVQEFEQPKDIDKNAYIHLTSYMLKHKNYIALSVYAKTAYTYMRDWARYSTIWLESGEFEYSVSMLENIGVMSSRQAKRCFDELEQSGFILRVNYNRAGARETARWRFIDTWFSGIKADL